MKQLLAIILIVVCVGSVAAQEPVVPKTAIFSGVIYDSDIGSSGKQLSGRYGLVQNITGALFIMPNVEFGKYNSLATEVALLFSNETSPWIFGILAGPNVDWVYPAEDPITYLNGAAGGLIAYDMGDFGFWLGGKYKFSIADDDMFNDGFLAGIGVYSQF
jgi:hypothetical protein